MMPPLTFNQTFYESMSCLPLMVESSTKIACISNSKRVTVRARKQVVLISLAFNVSLS